MSMLLRLAVVAVGGLVVAGSSANAQVIYEPTRYEYRVDGDRYYYGGTDPRVHELAEWNVRCSRMYDVHRREEDNGWIASRHTFGTRLPRVYNDCLPETNAAFFGYGISEARTDSRNNSPRNFTKRQLKQNAVVLENGVRVVPATADLKPEVPEAVEPAAEGVLPKPIMVIPRQSLPQGEKPGKLVASAD